MTDPTWLFSALQQMLRAIRVQLPQQRRTQARTGGQDRLGQTDASDHLRDGGHLPQVPEDSRLLAPVHPQGEDRPQRANGSLRWVLSVLVASMLPFPSTSYPAFSAALYPGEDLCVMLGSNTGLLTGLRTTFGLGIFYGKGGPGDRASDSYNCCT